MNLEWVNMFLKFIVKQLRHSFFFFGAIRLLHLIIQRKLHSKILFRSQFEYVAPIWYPYNDTGTEMVKNVQKTVAMWTCRRWKYKSSVGDMLYELEWSSLEDRRVKSLTFLNTRFIRGTVSLDKDKYLTPAPNLRRTRASHD